MSANWGLKTVPGIAKCLNRTENAVELKAKKLGLGGASTADEYMTANQVAKMMGVDIHVVIDHWIAKCGLQAKKRVVRTSKK